LGEVIGPEIVIGDLASEDLPDRDGQFVHDGDQSALFAATGGEPPVIDMDAWLLIEDDCQMKYQIVVPTEAQIELWHGTGSLHMTMGEAGLIGLMAFIGVVLREMQARAESAQARVTTPTAS
jgi:hypothetical protein